MPAPSYPLMSSFATTWRYKLDPELRLIHIFHNCRALKVAIKYGYATEFKLKQGDELDALRLDELVEKEGYRTCHACWAREQILSRKGHRRLQPGFKKEPAK